MVKTESTQKSFSCKKLRNIKQEEKSVTEDKGENSYGKGIDGTVEMHREGVDKAVEILTQHIYSKTESPIVP